MIMMHFETSSERKSVYLSAIYLLAWLSSREVNLIISSEGRPLVCKMCKNARRGDIVAIFRRLWNRVDFHRGHSRNITIFMIHLRYRFLLFSLESWRNITEGERERKR